ARRRFAERVFCPGSADGDSPPPIISFSIVFCKGRSRMSRTAMLLLIRGTANSTTFYGNFAGAPKVGTKFAPDNVGSWEDYRPAHVTPFARKRTRFPQTARAIRLRLSARTRYSRRGGGSMASPPARLNAIARNLRGEAMFDTKDEVSYTETLSASAPRAGQ